MPLISDAQIPPISRRLPRPRLVLRLDLVGRPSKGIRGIIPFSLTTLWRKVRAGEFPALVKLSAGVTALPLERLREWMTQYQ